ncbi:amino acid transporter protein [uncultured Methylobacterium sp.]|uniref:amino acid transporter protein n=1 Tax=uncultured Methylobacterium sp. TaxID=157278 RepID=UPI0035CBA010
MSEPSPPSALEPEDRQGVPIANERAKRSATYANGIAISIFAVGGLAPVFSVFYGSAPSSVPASAVLFSAGVCWFMSGVLHLPARRFLRRLRP